MSKACRVGVLGACVIGALAACGQDVATGRRCSSGDRACVASGGSGHATAGASGSIGGPAGEGAVVSTDNPLTIHVEDIEDMRIEIITLACAGDCADIEAVVHGGNPPYALEWEDGSTSAARRVCLDASTELEVSATDTGIDIEEFKYEAHTIATQVSARVLACIDGGTPLEDGGAVVCEANEWQSEDMTADIFGAPTHFADRAALPAGRYRIRYVDGCLKYDANWTWTVQGAPTFQYQLIGATTADFIAVLPGTEAPIGFGVTGYLDFEECVTANRALPPLDFDFAGGPLGIWNNDFKFDDNLPGEGGRNPTYRLEAACP